MKFRVPLISYRAVPNCLVGSTLLFTLARYVCGRDESAQMAEENAPSSSRDLTTVPVTKRFNRRKFSMFMVSRQSLLALATVIVESFGLTNLAQAQVADTWAYDKGAFMQVKKGKWQELQYGRVVFNFNETARSANNVILYDASRGITVNLTDGNAQVSSGAAILMNLSGRFFYKEWTYADGKGKFIDVGNKKWQELQNGKVAFHFVQSARTTNTVELYDASRGINVSLAPGLASVSQYGSSIGGIQGNWSK